MKYFKFNNINKTNLKLINVNLMKEYEYKNEYLVINY